MKEGWKKEKFEDVFDLQMGKTPSRDNPSYWDGTNTWVSISDMKDKKYISKSKEQISDIAVKDSGIKQVKKGTAIMSFKLSIGKTAIAEEDLFTNEAIMAFNVREGYGITSDYIYYYLRGYKWDGANKAVMGATLNKKTIASNYFSYPSLPEQERIVAELDCLSDIIEKQKQQLKELDNLAQSIFYTTFGDPISNNFGWDIKLLGEVCEELFAGGDKPKDTCETKTDVYQYPIYANGDGDRGLLGYSKTYRVKKPAVTLGARGASVGNCRICEGCFTPVVRLITMVPSDLIDITYLYYSIRLLKFNVSGAGQAQLTTPNVINKEIPLPPLYLQQEFASKVEAIEKQKDMIKQSIAETETLFNSRMDYYFN